MSAVWVVRDDGKVEAAFPREDDAVDYRHLYGAEDMTVTRETLITPAHTAVIALVNRLYEHHACIKGMGNEARLNCWDDLMQAAATLRKQEAQS